MADVKIIVRNPNMTVARLRKKFFSEVTPVLCEQIITDSNEFVRRQDGDLARSAHPEQNGKNAVWSTPYASIVYYTGTPRKNKNPNASLRWCEVAKRKYAVQWGTLATKLINKG